MMCGLFGLLTAQANAQATSEATLNLTGSVTGEYGLAGDKNIDLTIEANSQTETTETNALTFFSNKVGNYTVAIKSTNGGLTSRDNVVSYKVALSQGGGNWGSFSAYTMQDCEFSGKQQVKACTALKINTNTRGEIKPAVNGGITAKITVNLDGSNAVELRKAYTDTLILSVAEF